MKPRLSGRIRRHIVGFVNQFLPFWFYWRFGIQIAFAHACAIHWFPEYTDRPAYWFEIL